MGDMPGLIAFFVPTAVVRIAFWPPMTDRRIVAETPKDLEIRIMPSGDDCWYWEVSANDVIARGVADMATAACEEAHEAARKANLVE
jgi:hypothetical protein